MADCGEAIPLSDRERWDGALARVPHAFGHTWDSCNAMQHTTGHPTFLYRYASPTAEFVCPFAVRSFEGREDILTPYGFSGFTGTGDALEMLGAWRDFATSNSFVCGYIGLNPLLAPQELLQLPECRSSGELHFLDLTMQPDELLSRMSSSRRRQIRNWHSKETGLVDDQGALTEFFCGGLVPFLKSRNAAETYEFAPQTLELLASSRSSFLLGAAHDSIEAAILIAHSPTIGEYLFIVTTPGGEDHTAPLIWESARILRAQGVKWLCLGGEVSANPGIAEFKRRFGARRMSLPVLEQIYDRPAFDRMVRQAGADQLSSSYFPPYHRRSTNVR